MTNDWNVAEREERIMNNPTLEECYKTGRLHKQAYGWTPCPWGHWSDERKAAYMSGYRGLPFEAKDGKN